jgi:hypothetical protein
MEILIKIGIGILIASFSSYLTLQIALRRFRTEKWWERKVEAYSSLLNTLHKAKLFSDSNLEAFHADSDITPDEEKRIRDITTLCEAEMYRFMDVDAFILSSETIERLKKFRQQEALAHNSECFHSYITADLKAITTCLDDIRELAKKDLKVQNNFIL